MSKIYQYFDTDFENALRVNIDYPSAKIPCSAALLYDTNAYSAFCAFYFQDVTLQPAQFEEFLKTIKYGSTEVLLQGGIVLPSPRVFQGTLRVHNADLFRIEYQLFGDPAWRDLLKITPTRRVFIYAETSLLSEQINNLQTFAENLGHELQFRDATYVKERILREKPLAFISHDFHDKANIARPIALNLQRKICPVWYDEFSLPFGANLRESIERGLRECKKCVLILSPNFLSNRGWGKKEFESIFTREILEDSSLVLPIWSGVTSRQVYEYSPSLLNVKGIDWMVLGEDEVCRQIYLAVTSAT
ncbi:toll/interleukin-1 receptor domain-containing protein [Nitrosomonas sp.]|uniref:toll/interleukin-1 receptor domain-containing protein n=1 Tax=Nitrosomonas sp. TaxID=42353 RepID=UPI00260CEBD8|nr:toll/interleukin-1 receptor domain-containing protein [Nitrosomonas sp.]